MIVPMRKVFVACRSSERQRFLDALSTLGVVHVVPVDPGKAVVDEQLATGLSTLERALQILSAVTPAGAPTELPAREAAEQVLELQRRQAECESRLTALYRQLESTQAMWGDVRLDQLEKLRGAGVEVGFFSVPADQIASVRAACVQRVGELSANRNLVAVVSRNGPPELPEDAESIAWPSRDAASIRAEAGRLDAERKQAAETLASLAAHVSAIEAERDRMKEKALFDRTLKSGLERDSLFAVQGWVPADQAEGLAHGLSTSEIDAAVASTDADPDEQPPTLIHYPKWVQPIKAMFKILGTVPGYHEFDLSAFFMVALPLFGAMLLGDGGYGLVFLLIGVLGYRRIEAGVSRDAANLIITFGTMTLIWGTLTANYFGITPAHLAYAAGVENVPALREASGLFAFLGRTMLGLGILWNPDDEVARNIIIKASFLIGGTHLVLAHLRQAIGMAPDSRFLAQLGWCSFLTGMLGVIWLLFFPDAIWMPMPVMAALLIVGAVLVILFSYPSPNPVKRIGLGVVANLLPMIGTFSDTVSYIRLMAVGLASYYIASAFNGLAYQVAQPSVWLVPASVLIVVLAHALNIVLGIIAIFAHGVRLNMLEFSSNAGVQWTGYPFAPFARQARTEA